MSQLSNVQTIFMEILLFSITYNVFTRLPNKKVSFCQFLVNDLNN